MNNTILRTKISEGLSLRDKLVKSGNTEAVNIIDVIVRNKGMIISFIDNTLEYINMYDRLHILLVTCSGKVMILKRGNSCANLQNTKISRGVDDTGTLAVHSTDIIFPTYTINTLSDETISSSIDDINSSVLCDDIIKYVICL